MIKTIIVENEKIALEGIAQIFEQYGFEIVKTATNGKEALDYLLNDNQNVRLVVADIKMPIMTGLELFGKCTELLSNPPKFLFITAYENFEYAKEAVNNGAIGFLSKMTLFTDIENNILKIKKILESQNSVDFSKVKADITEKYLTKEDSLPFTDEFADRQFVCTGFLLGDIPVSEEEKTSPLFPCAKIRPFHDMALYVYESDNAEEKEKELSRLWPSEKYYTYSSEPVNGVAGAYEAFCLVIRKLNGFKLPEKILTSYPADKNNLSALKQYENNLLNVLDLSQSITEPGMDWFNCVLLTSPDPDTLRGNIIYTLSLLVWKLELLHPENPAFAKLRSGLYELSATSSREELKEQVRKYFELLNECKNTNLSENKIKDYIFNIQTYVKNNLYEKIDLKSAANYYYISPSYFSFLFKKYFNVSFIHYVNEQKMKEAQKLLQSGYSVREVAEKLNYNDIKNFTRMYRKYYKVSPGKDKKTV